MYNKNQKINWYDKMEKIVINGMYPNVEMMELKITNVVAQGLITVEQGDMLRELLDKKENGELTN